jgi:predicted Zn finger-like uncharacterized protein
MKITCHSCQSKYTIADDKVLGKIVKIRCKKCAATIFVNGHDGTTSATGDAEHEPLSGYRAETPAEGWTVHVAEGDQRTMTDADIVAAFQAGSIDGETFCWKDGMADWIPLRQTGELFQACSAAAEKTGARPAPAAAARQEAPAALLGGSNGSGASLPAARRAGGRGTGVDLFGGALQAGSEEDVLTSAPAKMPQAHDDPQKPTGARNENSVLFSLSALTTKGASEPPPRAPGDEASGLIDIRQLSAQMAVEDKKQSRVDDIMNLSGGGAFSPNLTAPILSAPAFDAYAPDSVAGGGLPPAAGRSKGVIVLAIGAAACVIVAAVGGAVLLMRNRQTADVEKAGIAASANAPEPPASAVASAAPPPELSASAAGQPSATPSGSAAGKAAPAETKTAANAPPTKETTSAPPPVRAVVAAAPPVEAGPFNMGEAKARLGAAAAAAGGCKKPGGPTGTGRVVVLFGPSGAAQSATITGPPFEGTPTGACVGARFRAVRVPPFSGSPFSVSKSFTIN